MSIPNSGLSFKIVVDESYHNDTIKAGEILSYFKTDKIICTSATTKGYTDAFLKEDVIADGLIKKLLIINENFPQKIETEDKTEYLLDKALEKQQELYSAFLSHHAEINPLIIVQVPNNSGVLIDEHRTLF